jgi:4-hydroxybenzoate polyprenyltransferase
MSYKKLRGYIQLARVDKPIGIYLLLWPTLWALICASNGFVHIEDLTLFVLGVFLSRSAGCVINDIFDKNFDKKVHRTKLRPLVSGVLEKREAFILFFILLFCASCLMFFLTPLAIKVVFISALLLCTYPLAKRFMKIPQIYLGMAFSSSILVVFAHVNKSFPLICWQLFLANFFWVMAYDTIYAKEDYGDDVKLNIYSAPKFFKGKTIFYTNLFYFLMFFFFYQVISQFNDTFFVFLLILTLFITSIIRVRKLALKESKFIKLFKENNYLGAIMMVILLFVVNY